MQNIRLYKDIEDNTENNIEDMNDSLIVNCVGLDNRDDNFETHKSNGRNALALLRSMLKVGKTVLQLKHG